MVTVPEVDYQAVRDAIYPVPGLSFTEEVGREYNGPASARMLLGSVGPVTADDLKELGAPTRRATGPATATASRRRSSASSPAPSGEVRLVARDGKDGEAKVLHEFAGSDGEAVETTLDPLVQRAAEAALDPVASRPPWWR